MLYFLDISTDLKEIGAYFQVKSMSEGYDYGAANSISALSRLKNSETPDFQPDFDNFVLKPKARLTDLISQGYASDKGFLVNDKVSSILGNYNVDKGVYYPARVIHKEKIFPYFFLHITSYLIKYSDFVSFSESRFVEKRISERVKELSFDSYNGMLEYSRKMNVVHTIEYDRLVLRKEPFDPDMFRVGYVDNNIIVSERLKAALEAHKITGIEFTEAENIVIGS